VTADELDAYLGSLDLRVETIANAQGTPYTVVRDLEIPAGPLRRKCCDVAWTRSAETPYVMAAAIQTNPPLVAMGSSGTQPSPLAGWQYWSRRYDHPINPQRIWASVLTVLAEPNLVAV
jgi:hypothetical protein